MPIFKRTAEADPVGEKVTVRVTERGAGKISTGRHDAVGGEEYYDEGETLQVSADVAKLYAAPNGEHRFVTIVKESDDDKAAKAVAAAEKKAAAEAAKAAKA